MATISDVFAHSSAQVFPDEAPSHRSTIGERVSDIFDQELAAANAILVARYGIKSTLPVTSDTSRLTPQNFNLAQAASDGASVLLILLAVVVVVLLLRR